MQTSEDFRFGAWQDDLWFARNPDRQFHLRRVEDDEPDPQPEDAFYLSAPTHVLVHRLPTGGLARKFTPARLCTWEMDHIPDEEALCASLWKALPAPGSLDAVRAVLDTARKRNTPW